MTAPRITWIRAGDRYPELADDPDYFLALDADGTETRGQGASRSRRVP